MLLYRLSKTNESYFVRTLLDGCTSDGGVARE